MARTRRLSAAAASARSLPDVLAGAQLVRALRAELHGVPIGSGPPVPDTAPVVWVDAGDELLVHRDSLSVRFAPESIIVSMDVETVETGRQRLTVPLALGAPGTPSAAPRPVAVTSREPYTHPLVAARWGRIAQDAVWSALVAVAARRVGGQGLALRGIAIDHRKRAVRLDGRPRRQS